MEKTQEEITSGAASEFTILLDRYPTVGFIGNAHMETLNLLNDYQHIVMRNKIGVSDPEVITGNTVWCKRCDGECKNQPEHLFGSPNYKEPEE